MLRSRKRIGIILPAVVFLTLPAAAQDGGVPGDSAEGASSGAFTSPERWGTGDLLWDEGEFRVTEEALMSPEPQTGQICVAPEVVACYPGDGRDVTSESGDELESRVRDINAMGEDMEEVAQDPTRSCRVRERRLSRRLARLQSRAEPGADSEFNRMCGDIVGPQGLIIPGRSEQARLELAQDPPVSLDDSEARREINSAEFILAMGPEQWEERLQFVMRAHGERYHSDEGIRTAVDRVQERIKTVLERSERPGWVTPEVHQRLERALRRIRLYERQVKSTMRSAEIAATESNSEEERRQAYVNAARRIRHVRHQFNRMMTGCPDAEACTGDRWRGSFAELLDLIPEGESQDELRGGLRSALQTAQEHRTEYDIALEVAHRGHECSVRGARIARRERRLQTELAGIRNSCPGAVADSRENNRLTPAEVEDLVARIEEGVNDLRSIEIGYPDLSTGQDATD